MTDRDRILAKLRAALTTARKSKGAKRATALHQATALVGRYRAYIGVDLPDAYLRQLREAGR